MNARMPTPPAWAVLLTDDDEWAVRTALANVASDLERVADAAADPNIGTTGRAIRESAARYRDVLARIEEASAADEEPEVERKFEMWSPDGSYKMGNITAASKTAALDVARNLYGPSIAASQIKDPE